MKQHTTRNYGIMLVLDIVLGIVLSLYIANTGTVPAADNAATYADGSYTASAQGYVSEVSVTVTITGGKAAESLAPALVEAGGTAGVDAVTGSTMTSDAVFEAMDDCLAQAAQ